MRYKADFGFEQIPVRMADQIWHYLTLATEMDRKYRPRIMALSAATTPSANSPNGAAAGGTGGASSPAAPAVVAAGTQVNSLFHHHPLTFGPSPASNTRCNICTNAGASDFYSVYTRLHTLHI